MQKMVLPGGLDNPSIPPFPNRSARRRRRRRIGTVITGVVILALVLTGGSALALFKFNPALLSNALHHGGQKYQHNDMRNATASPTSTMTTGMNNMPQAATTINK